MTRTEHETWARVQLARHSQRPYTLDYLRLGFDDFVELHGDRMFADDPAIVGGLASLDSQTVMLVGHQKGRTVKEKVHRHFGMARPEGYRKAMRLVRQAGKLGLPVITLVDTPGADPSLASEERGQALAIAESLLTLAQVSVPVISVVTGEGGSGGALGLALADRVLMSENAVYSVASPEAAASILWRDGSRGPEAAHAMQITAPDLLRFGLIDGIVPEPAGGAHVDHTAAAEALRDAILDQLAETREVPIARLLAERHNRYRGIGLDLDGSLAA
jgi:acetyl-CoA carboxylase carboxyl transferase alpha subunit